MNKHYPIMDKPYKELILEEIEDTTVSLVSAAAKTFYKTKAELVAFTVATYMDTRFTKRIERFAKEEELLSKIQVRNFYENIDESNLDLLFELLEKTRTTTYDLHAKILCVLYVNFLNQGSLTYYEKTLISNLNMFVDGDFYMYRDLMNHYYNSYKKQSIYNCTSCLVGSMAVFQKFINIGFFTYPEVKVGEVKHNNYSYTDFIESEYTKDFLDILNKIIDE